jgi:transposase
LGAIRGRLFAVEWRVEDTEEALKAAYQAERDPAQRTRLHGLWPLRCGWTLGAAAGALGVHYRSVQRWAAWYRQGGLAGLRAHRMGGTGQETFPSAEAEAEVAAEVATGRFRTGAEIGEWIRERYGVSYTLGGVYSLLKRLRCAPKVPRPLHAKADIERQDAWKKGGSSERWPRPA